jgi:hypothetical protein
MHAGCIQSKNIPDEIFRDDFRREILISVGMRFAIVFYKECFLVFPNELRSTRNLFFTSDQMTIWQRASKPLPLENEKNSSGHTAPNAIGDHHRRVVNDQHRQPMADRAIV